MTDKATIEIMQNRRVLFDDDLGIEEALNETDADGFGLRVNALYYLHIFDMQKGASVQRQQQLRIQQRPEYFFVFDYSTDAGLVQHAAQANASAAPSTALDFHASAFAGDGTYRLFPVAKNEILVRFENLADRFDATPARTPTT